MFDENRVFLSTDADAPCTQSEIARLTKLGRYIEVPQKTARAKAATAAVPLHVATETKVAAKASSSPAGSVLIGHSEGKPALIDLRRLLAHRMLIQGSSGAGKSSTIRRLIEEAHRQVAVILVDPERDFDNLASYIGAATVRASETATDALTGIEMKVRAHRLHFHLDLSDLDPISRIEKAAAFFAGLVGAPREHWSNTALVVVDEAHLLAPNVASSARGSEAKAIGVATLTDLASRGRKRGLAAVLATQRLAKLSASVVSEVHNFMLGLNVYERDVKIVADLLGYSYDRAAVVRDLEPGSFYALGPAISRTAKLINVGSCVTEHHGATPDLLPAAKVDASKMAEMLDLEGARDGNMRSVRRDPIGRTVHALDSFITDPSAVHAAAISAALSAIAPNATTAEEIEKKMSLPSEAVHGALDLLFSLGVIDSSPRGSQRLVALSKRTRARVAGPQVVGLS